ncbi:MAG: hypothetical protein AB7K52_11025 [Phycisphaerales bacterium]
MIRGLVVSLAVLVLTGLMLPACDEKGTTRAHLPAGLMVSTRPEGARPVEEWVSGGGGGAAPVRAGDLVVVSGRVGGSEEPFAADRAAMVIVGPGIKACADQLENHCGTPWDYCCERREDLAIHSALVEVVGPDGAVLSKGLKGHGGMKELSGVVVVGRVVRRDDSGDGPALIIHAAAIHVEKP